MELNEMTWMIQKKKKERTKKKKEDTYPNIELDVFVTHSFHVKSDGGNRCNGLVQFQFVQNSCEDKFE
jgi:hypothetical protein